MVGKKPKYCFPSSLGSLFWEDYTSWCFYKNYMDAKMFPKLLFHDQYNVTGKADQKLLWKWVGER